MKFPVAGAWICSILSRNSMCVDMHKFACIRISAPAVVAASLAMWLQYSWASPVDTVSLKSGKSMQGTIIECTDTLVKLRTGEVSLTYYLEDVATINAMQPAAAMAEITGISPADRSALQAWERCHRMTAADYWRARQAFEKGRRDYDESIRALIGEYFSTNIRSLEDIHEKNIALPQGFIDEFKRIKHPPTHIAAKFNVPPPPGKPPRWYKDSTR